MVSSIPVVVQLEGGTNKLIWGDNKLILSSLKSDTLHHQIEDVGGLTQSRLNDLLRGRIDKFSLYALVNMLARAGKQVSVKVRKAA